jgi:hypothetical protein
VFHKLREISRLAKELANRHVSCDVTLSDEEGSLYFSGAWKRTFVIQGNCTITEIQRSKLTFMQEGACKKFVQHGAIQLLSVRLSFSEICSILWVQDVLEP